MLGKIALVLLIVGGLNWGLVGLFNFDLVAFIFGGGSLLARAVYVVVAVSALLCLPMLMTDQSIGTDGM